MVTVSPILSVLVSALMETLLYGINVAFFFIAMYLLLRKKVSTATRRPLICALILLFFSLTGHVAVQWRRLLDAFYYAQTKEESVAYFLSLSEKTNIIKQHFGVFITLFQDIILVWRLYIVWGSNLYICIVPTAMLFGTFATGITMSYMESRSLASDRIFERRISQFGLAYNTITLVTNLLVTLLIAGRVWFANRRLHVSSLWRAIIIIIESAAVTAAMQIVHLTVYALKSPVDYFLGDSTLQIMGLVPTAIIIAVKLGGSDDDMGTTPHTKIVFHTGRPMGSTPQLSLEGLDEHSMDISVNFYDIKGDTP